jgi:hypothetical protein
MNTFYPRPIGPTAPLQPAANLLHRRPTRVTSTISWQLHQRLQQRADEEGRSLSNLIAFLLEGASS